MHNKKRLFILGAGGFGREVESWLEMVPQKHRDWYIAGYINKDKNALRGFACDYEIVGDEDTYLFKPDDVVIVAIAEPEIKEAIYNKLKSKARFFTYIAPGVILGKYSNIAEGAVICPGCIISTNITIGKLVTINTGTQVGHDVLISDFSSIMANVDIGGKCQLGKKVFVGTNTTIIPERKVCDNAKIGTGSIVLRNIKDTRTVFGNPAKTV